MTARLISTAALWILAVGTITAGTGPAQSPSSRYAVRWERRGLSAVVIVTGLPAAARHALRSASWTPDRWASLLSVSTSRPSSSGEGDLVMSGRYAVAEDGFSFVPAFPLQQGVRYYAVFRPNGLPQPDSAPPIVKDILLPRKPSSTAVVSAVYPSASVLPENLLKFYVHFSAPMSRGDIYDHIRLLDDNDRRVDLPFLEIDEELWNPPMTRVTLFIDPGRIKRGVKPLEDIGSALETGKRYTLIISREWRDAGGNRLKRDHRKRFRVGKPDRIPIDPRVWRIRPPKSGTRNPLKVEFGESVDHALGMRLILIETQQQTPVPGRAALESAESRWVFIPQRAWKQGSFALVAATRLEDLAGNNIGKPFEVDVFNTVQDRLTSETIRVPFRVR